jgi:hypothetical protein
MRSIWKTFIGVVVSYLLIALLGVLFIEGILGGCDVGKCFVLPIR